MMHTTDIPRPLHPMPDRMRSRWMNLNGEWEFSFDEPIFDRTITVPFSWASPLSGIAEDRKGTGWYRRFVSYHPGKNHLFLILGAVDYDCDVFVNAQHLAHHLGGYTPISVDVTPAWDPDGLNEIIIRAEDNDYRYQTYGKQGYGNIRGIWQTVWLEERPAVYIEKFQITTRCNGQITIRVTPAGGPWTKLCASFGGYTDETDGATLVLHLEQPRLWSPDDPYLYEGKLQLWSETPDGPACDEIETYFGVREIGTARVDGNRRKYITLNGKPVYIHATLDQSFNPQGYFTLPTDEETRNEILRLKAVGLNAARIHIKPEEPRKLYWADKLGLLILEDIPCYWGEPNGVARALYEPQMFEVLERDVNHPSIFYWVVFNETWGLFTEVKQPDGSTQKVYTKETQDWVVRCYEAVKGFDPTRLVEDNSVCNRDHTVTDVNTWHFYANGYENARARILEQIEGSDVGGTFNYADGYACEDVPLVNSECGAVWGVEGSAGDSDISWQYKYMINEFRLHDEVSGFVFTEFHDVVNEFNGYYRIDNSEKEFGYGAYVPDMSLKDLHSADFLAVDFPPMKTCTPGETVTIPLVISSFTDAHHGQPMAVAWELVLQDGRRMRSMDGGQFPVTYTRWGNTVLEPLRITMPYENGVATLRLWLKETDGEIVMRNFLVFDVQAPVQALSVPLDQFDCSGFRRAWLVQQGEKLNCLGEGTATLTVNKRDIPGYHPGAAITVRFEASSREEMTRDLPDGEQKSNEADLGYMLGYRVDRGANPNSFYQTDPQTVSSKLILSFADMGSAVFGLADSPADSRGCLSWHYQAVDNRLDEAGSFGYLCSATLDGNMADRLPETFTIRLQSRDGFSVFGRRSGRYPVGFELIAE